MILHIQPKTMPVTETERLIVDNAQLSDSSFIFELTNSDGWLEFIGDRGIKTLKDAENYIQTSLIDKYNELGFGLYKLTLKKNRTPIGLCGFVQRDYLDAPDIGFAMLPEFEGNGYMYEAASQLLKESEFQKIYAITSIDNRKSGKLLNKLGLFQVDTIKPSKDPLLLFLRENWPPLTNNSTLLH
jgi:RimJ/RimL family protein N-acetyltransferase